MAGQRFIAHGTSVTFASSTIGGLVSLSAPERTKGEAETTDADSNHDREYLPGLREGGSVTLEYRFIDGDAGQQALEDNYDADNATEEMVITLPSAATDDSEEVTWTFDGFVTALGVELPQTDDEAVNGTCTVKVDGGVTKDTS
ncbi:MAG: hypothetical protein ACOC8B_08280 [Gemmatimonadota bacterium]